MCYLFILKTQRLMIGNRYSILPAITLDGIIECAIVEGSFNTERFTSFIKDLILKMAPYPAPKSVIVMDNCAIHKAPEIRELIEERCVAVSCSEQILMFVLRGMKLEFLPAYSPDFNPIELAFSFLKSRLRRYSPPEGDDFAVQEFLYMQVFSIPAENCRAFFHQSGYL